MREQSGVAALSGEGLPADGVRSGAESTQAATSDYIDKIQASNNTTAIQPGIPGTGGMTNPALGNLMANVNNNNNTTGVTNNTTNANNNAAGNNPGGQEDISPEGLLQVISQEWQNEMERIRGLGLNGYKRRKESRSECLVQSGHAEIEGDNKLFIYGNALEVLNNPDFQKTVEQISF